MTEEKVEEKVEEKTKETYILKEVVTQTEVAIGKSNSDGVFSDRELFVEILNKLDRIEKAITQ